MPQEYVKLYVGSSIAVMAVVDALEQIGIIPVVKKPSESARLAGFGVISSDQSVWVHLDEQTKDLEILETLEL